MVQTVAAGRLFRNGIMMRDGAALERAAVVTEVVFDKTGTLTRGEPTLEAQGKDQASLLQTAASLAAHSTHALATFLWALRSGQYEDLKGAGERILQDDPRDHPGSN